MGARGSWREWDVNTKVQCIFKSEYEISCRTGSVPYLDCDSGSKIYTRLFTIMCVCVCVYLSVCKSYIDFIELTPTCQNKKLHI